MLNLLRVTLYLPLAIVPWVTLSLPWVIAPCLNLPYVTLSIPWIIIDFPPGNLSEVSVPRVTLHMVILT